MKNRALLLAASGLVLFGCASVQTPPGGACNTNVCHIQLTVTSCLPHGSKITADQDPSHIGPGSHEVHFDIATAGYEFTDNGITFKKPTGGAFTAPRKLTPTKYKWHDDNAAPGTYDYNVELVSASGGICRYDPTIVND